jgi:hypothetical protein
MRLMGFGSQYVVAFKDAAGIASTAGIGSVGMRVQIPAIPAARSREGRRAHVLAVPG